MGALDQLQKTGSNTTSTMAQKSFDDSDFQADEIPSQKGMEDFEPDVAPDMSDFEPDVTVDKQPNILDKAKSSLNAFNDTIRNIPIGGSTVGELGAGRGKSDLQRVIDEMPEVTIKGIKESFKRGAVAAEIDQASYLALTGELDYDKHVKPLKDQQKAVETADPIKGKNAFSNAIYAVAGMAPAMISGIVEGAGTGAAAGLAATAGGVTAPLAVPAFGVGQVYGSFDYWRRQGAGQLYADLKSKEIPENISKPTAHIAGALYGAVEFSQVDKLIPGAAAATKRYLSDSIQKTIGRMALAYGANWAQEVGEEGLQEIVMSAAEETSTKIAGKSDKANAKIIKDVLVKGWETSKESALPMLLLMTPKAAFEGVQIAQGENLKGEVRKAMAKKVIEEAKLEEVSTDVAKKPGISVNVTPEIEAVLEKSDISEQRRADIIRILEAPEPVKDTKEEKPTTEPVKEETPVIEPQITAQPEVQAPKEAETTRSVSTDGTGEEKTPPVISPSDKELSDRAVMSQWHKAETGKPVTVTAWHVEGDKSKTGLMPDAREKLGRETELGEGWYGARDKDIAETYGKGAKQYKVKLTNPYVIRTMDRRHALNNLSNEKLKEIIDAGHDGILVTTPKANYSSGDRGQVQVVKFSAAKAKPTEKPLTQEVKPSKPEDFDTAEEYVASKGRPLWHGSNTEIEKFDPSMLGKSTGAKSAEHGFFLTNDFEEALGYGDIATGKKGEGIKVTKAWADLKNPKIIDFKGKDYPEGEINKLVLEAKKEGHDGAILKNIADSPLAIGRFTTHTVVFDASKIKTKPQLTAEFNAAKAKQAEKPLTSEVKEKAPVAEKGEVKPSEEKKITPPAFREWRFTKTASNSGNILPNKVGTKFTQDQVNELVAWAEANGMSVTRPTTTVIHVIGDTGTPISLSMMGAYGVKQEKLKAKDEIRKAEEERKRIERKEKAEGAESSKWIDSTFGVGTMNDFNKIELADFLEGRKENFGGIMSPKWVDGFKKIDAVSNVGIVDWNKVKKAYQDSKPEAKVEPVKDNNPFKNEFEPVKVWSIKISNRQGDSYSLSYNLKPEQGGGAVIEYLGEITSKEKLERINFLNGRSSLKTIKEEINDNPVREAKVEEKPITEEQDEDIQRSEQAETVTAERPIFNKDDIDLRQATQAYTAISHSPERRAEQERQDYVEHLNAVYDGFLKIAKSNEQKKILNEEIERYRQGYLSHRKAVLSAKSRTMSAMIVGPAKFPSSRNQKRLDTEMKRNDELIEWSKKAQKSMEKRILAQGVQEAGGETEVLKKQIADAEKFQQQMRDSNAAIRKGKTDDEKVAGVVATGLPEKIARELLKPDFMGRFGFADYQMTSNNAKIKRMKEKLAGFEKQDAATPEDTKELKFEGGVILDNVADDRVQIIYDAKPDEKVRLSLRGRGFLWSPKNGAWQRKRTTSALYDAMNLTGAKESSKATSMTPDQSIESISKGEANTIVTQKDYRDTVDRINSKMRRLSANPMADPELWADLLKAGVFHVERGGRTFAAWSERMVYEFGEAIRPHLDNIWKGVTNDAPVTDIPPVPTKLPQGDKTAKAASLLEGSKPKTAQTQTGKESGTRVQQGSTTPVLESQTGMQEQQKALGEAVSVSSNENIAQKEQNIKQSRVFQRAKAKYEGLQSSSDVTYDVKTLEDQIARAMDMSEKDPVRFKKIALGHMNAPEGVTDTAINIVYSEKMLEEGNGAEAFRAIRNHSLKQTERGQEIAMENARATNVNDAQAFIQKVIEAKMMNAGKKLYEFSTREKSGSSKKAATEKIKQEVRRVKEIVDSKQLDIAEAQKLIDELGCK